MIRMNDFRSEPEALREVERSAMNRVLDSGWYVLGNEVQAFEQSWANCCGTSEAVGVGNGMDAIEIGLRASGIGCGDEVITTAMTAFATVLAIMRAGATPVLADIDPETALLDLRSAERCLSSKTKAVLLVHLYGQIKRMDAWTDFCETNRILLLEDCAQSHLASWKGKVSGSFGVWGAYSFYPTKNLGAKGDGGALVTNLKAIAKISRSLRNYGQEERYHHPVQGLNSRLDELQAALLSARLEWLKGFTTRRREIAHAYYSRIDNPHVRLLCPPNDEDNHVYHLFVVLSDERDRLTAYLKDKGVESLSHYPVPIHFQEPCRLLRSDPQGLKYSEIHASECLSIPCHPQLSDSDVSHVIQAINEFR